MPSGWWVTNIWNESPVLLLAHVFWVIFSITLHELAHGWTAIRCGDRTPVETGHMTWNPFVHMGGTSLILFALVGIAWGAMPINPNNLRGRFDHARVALAGPMANIALFLLCIVVVVSLRHFGRSLDPTTMRNLVLFFFAGAYLNMGLAIFNMLPVPPLDGWRILSDLWRGFGELWNHPSAGMISIGLFLAMFYLGGRYIWGIAGEVTGRVLDLAMRLTGTPIT